MSSPPRRSAPNATYENDPAVMEEVTIDRDVVVSEDGGGPVPIAESGGNGGLSKGCGKRFSIWVVFFAAIAVCYASLVMQSDYYNSPDSNTRGGKRKLCFSIMGTSLLVAIGVVGSFSFPNCNACSRVFVSPSSSTGRYVELVLVSTILYRTLYNACMGLVHCVFLLLFLIHSDSFASIQSTILLVLWCIGLPVLMNPAYGFAVGSTDGFAVIYNANLYLAAWVSFGCVLYIVGDLVGELYPRRGIDPSTGEYLNALEWVDYKGLWETRRGKWIALTALSAIALTGSIRNRSGLQDTASITLTALACVTAPILAVLSGMDVHPSVERVGALWTTVVWALGLGFITFGDGPGRAVGNLFFSTWVAFYVSVKMAADVLQSVELPADVEGDDEDIL